MASPCLHGKPDIREEPGRVVIRFDRNRAWPVVAMATIFVPVWTYVGLSELAKLLDAPDGPSEFLFRALLWVLGECFLLALLVSELFVRDLLIVNPVEVELRREIGRFTWTQTYRFGLVTDVRVIETTDEKSYARFAVAITSEGRPVTVAFVSAVADAERVASLLRAWALRHAQSHRAGAPAV